MFFYYNCGKNNDTLNVMMSSERIKSQKFMKLQLKPNAKIFLLDEKSDLLWLEINFPSPKGDVINWEFMYINYDGIRMKTNNGMYHLKIWNRSCVQSTKLVKSTLR